MGSEDEHLGYLDVSGRLGGIEGYVGNVVAGEGFDAPIDLLCPFGIAPKAYTTEVGLA